MTKNHTGNKPATDSDGTLNVPPPATPNQLKTPPYVRLNAALREYEIMKNGAVFRLFFELVCSAPDFERWSIIDNFETHLEPRQGIFKGLLFARRLGCSRSTVWRQIRSLQKAGFVKRIVKPSYSLYILTGKGLPAFHRFTDATRVVSPPVIPPATPQRTQVIDHIILTNREYMMTQKRLLKHSPCEGLDLGLPEEIKTWLISGVCIYHQKHGDCKTVFESCLYHLDTLAEQIRGYKIKKNIQGYIQVVINDYFYEGKRR
jgi:hypothetical protein